MMDDLISRAAAIDALKRAAYWQDGERKIAELPAVDAAPVVHARWRELKDGTEECTNCLGLCPHEPVVRREDGRRTEGRQMRMIDADALLENQPKGCYRTSDWINEAPTIPAIPVEWLKQEAMKDDSLINSVIRGLLMKWQKEQEAR